MFHVSFHGREFAYLFADALIEKIFATSTESILDKLRKADRTGARRPKHSKTPLQKCAGKKPGPTSRGV